MINEYYIIADGASIKPRVLVWNGDKEEFLPLAVFGIKDHATIKIQNNIRHGKINQASVIRISEKGTIKYESLKDKLKLI